MKKQLALLSLLIGVSTVAHACPNVSTERPAPIDGATISQESMTTSYIEAMNYLQQSEQRLSCLDAQTSAGAKKMYNAKVKRLNLFAKNFNH